MRVKKIQVKRLDIEDYNELVRKLGSGAKFVEVPSQTHHAFFRGVYTNFLMTSIAVPWPVNRPMEHQEIFAEEKNCGFPSEFYEVKKQRSH
jgi:hypothetical protein